MIDLDEATVGRVVRAALEEDLGHGGDVTTAALFPASCPAKARIEARQTLVVAGLPVARAVFAAVDPDVRFTTRAGEGERVGRSTVVAELAGDARSILQGERTALNFLMRMCGVATAAAAAVAEVAGTGAIVLDTRKTAPGLRALDKYAVAAGGATNHRLGLFDAVLIKDTHLGMGLGVAEAVRRARAAGHAAETITVEVGDLAALAAAIAAGAGRALCDNMEPALLREAVWLAAGRIVLEASGGLRPGALREVAATGVHCLSLGWLTHSAPAADLALELQAA